MRYPTGGRLLEALSGENRRAGAARAHERQRARWRTQRIPSEVWDRTWEVPDWDWLHGPAASRARDVLQRALLFPVARVVADPDVDGLDWLRAAPQPAVIAPTHWSDLDTPLVLLALPPAWRRQTVVGAASDRFYRSRGTALLTGSFFNTFPFDRGAELRGLASAARFLRDGRNVLLYPQGTRSSRLDGFRLGVGRLCTATGTPLIPVHVSGTALLMPKDVGLRRRGRTRVRFGQALHPEPDETPQEFTSRASDAIVQLERVRTRPADAVAASKQGGDGA
jgi:1-acyl-sn-glycerol-3-phosphate acyltransferase